MSLVYIVRKAANSDIELSDNELQMRRFESGESHFIHSPDKVTAVIVEQDGIKVYRAYFTWGVLAQTANNRIGFTVIGRDVVVSRSKPGVIQGTKDLLLDYLEGDDGTLVREKVGTRHHIY